MTFGELLHGKKDAIAKRWLGELLATYPEYASKVFKREADPFANPVGRSLRVGTLGILDCLLGGVNGEKMRAHVTEIIRVRAVQQFSPSQAVRFAFRLKDAVRAELGSAASDPQYADEWVMFESQIDRMALLAFDIFVECREQVYELRVNEVKRRVSWVVEKMQAGTPDEGDS